MPVELRLAWLNVQRWARSRGEEEGRGRWEVDNKDCWSRRPLRYTAAAPASLTSLGRRTLHSPLSCDMAATVALCKPDAEFGMGESVEACDLTYREYCRDLEVLLARETSVVVGC